MDTIRIDNIRPEVLDAVFAIFSEDCAEIPQNLTQAEADALRAAFRQKGVSSNQVEIWLGWAPSGGVAGAPKVHGFDTEDAILSQQAAYYDAE